MCPNLSAGIQVLDLSQTPLELVVRPSLNKSLQAMVRLELESLFGKEPTSEDDGGRFNRVIRLKTGSGGWGSWSEGGLHPGAERAYCVLFGWAEREQLRRKSLEHVGEDYDLYRFEKQLPIQILGESLWTEVTGGRKRDFFEYEVLLEELIAYYIEHLICRLQVRPEVCADLVKIVCFNRRQRMRRSHKKLEIRFASRDANEKNAEALLEYVREQYSAQVILNMLCAREKQSRVMRPMRRILQKNMRIFARSLENSPVNNRCWQIGGFLEQMGLESIIQALPFAEIRRDRKARLFAIQIVERIHPSARLTMSDESNLVNLCSTDRLWQEAYMHHVQEALARLWQSVMFGEVGIERTHHGVAKSRRSARIEAHSVLATMRLIIADLWFCLSRAHDDWYVVAAKTSDFIKDPTAKIVPFEDVFRQVPSAQGNKLQKPIVSLNSFASLYAGFALSEI